MAKQSAKQTIFYIIIVALWVALASIACQLIIAYPMVWLLGERFTQPFWTFVYYLLNYSLTLLTVIFVPIWFKKLYQKHHEASSALAELTDIDITTLGISHLPTFVDIGLAPIGYIVYIVIANLVTNLVTHLLPWFDPNQTQDVGFGYFVTTGDRIFAMLAIVLIAPIAEELIMRGWFHGKIRTRLKAIPAMLLVSFVFAALHGQWNVGLNVFILSLILCGLREITGTIWSGMLLHIISNGIAFYLLYIALV